MRSRKALALLSALVLALSLAAAAIWLVHWPPRFSTNIAEETGRVLAREALNLLGPDGRITVIARDTEAFAQPAAAAQLRALEAELSKAKAAIAAKQLLQLDPLRPIQVPPGDFYELLRRAKPGDVLVSLMGPPLLNADQRANLGAIKPKVVAFCPGNQADYLNLRFLFEQKLLHTALVGRVDKLQPGATTRADAETFDAQYLLVTAASLAKLPPNPSPAP